MSLSFTIPSKFQSNRPKKPSSSTFSDHQQPTNQSKNYVNEFNATGNEQSNEPQIKPIAPIPNEWRPNKKLKNLHTLPPLSQPNTGPHFEIDTGASEKPEDNSMTYGLNIRPSGENNGDQVPNRHESIAELELRKLREDLDKLPNDTGMEEFEDVPVEGFGAALLLGYGWKEGRGIGRNAKEDVKIKEGVRKAGRGGLGFTDDFPEDRVVVNENTVEKNENAKKKSDVGKEVRILHGREMGMKGKVVEVRSDGDLLVLRLSKSEERVKVRSRDVAEVGSVEEDKFLRKLKELRIKEKDVVGKDKRDRDGSSKTGVEKGRVRGDRVNWLRNHIRVRIVSKELKGGKLYLKKGMVVDVVGPGVCDISMDESRELIQGVDQDLLETALPKRGGPVLVLSGRYKGVYGNLLERDTEKEKGVVRDADTHELLNVKLEEIAEFTGDPSDIGY